jgi:hypothetical protein
LSPNTPLFNILVTADSLPARQRLDPEYFITPQGPYLYYNRIVPETGSTRYKNEGEWFIDMQLGAPSGPCVGSSAEDGLNPTALSGGQAACTGGSDPRSDARLSATRQPQAHEIRMSSE